MKTQKNTRINSKPLLAPSLLSANLAQLGKDVESLVEAKADWLHVDVMDGHFVPNLTFGPWIVETIRPLTRLPIDCHLMVSEPEKWVGPFAAAGADFITVHAESVIHLDRLLQQIRELGCKAGVSINPSSSLSLIEEVLDCVDLVLIMSVNPGFGGQKFIESSISKIEKLVQLRGSREFLIEVDGGVNLNNIERLRKAGAEVFVAGSAVFSGKDLGKTIGDLKTRMGA